MTQKRFEVSCGDLWDNHNEEMLMMDFEKDCVPRIVDLLNELATKCSQLKKENEQLKLQNKKYFMMVNANHDLNDEIYEQLKKTEKNYKSVLEENEQLKKQLSEIAYYFRDEVTRNDLDNKDFEELKRLSKI